MKCPACIQACKDEGGLCLPLTAEDLAWYEDWMIKEAKRHKREEHAMTLQDGFYRCKHGHEPIEAPPVEAMREAGIKPLF